MKSEELKVTNEQALLNNAWFQLGMKSGNKNTVICVREQLELLRAFKKVRTKKQVIDFMQDFCLKLLPKKEAQHEG